MTFPCPGSGRMAPMDLWGSKVGRRVRCPVCSVPAVVVNGDHPERCQILEDHEPLITDGTDGIPPGLHGPRCRSQSHRTGECCCGVIDLGAGEAGAERAPEAGALTARERPAGRVAAHVDPPMVDTPAPSHAVAGERL